MAEPFKFKAFQVHQDQCAMKVGTDGVLLGAWTDIAHQPNSILDIGSGTGLIALMLAQRSPAELIDAVEFNTNAYIQAVENFEASPWGDRLFCYHADFKEFAQEMDEPYDLIVSNPPFFEAPKADYAIDEARKTARFTDQLNFTELLKGVNQLLSEHGQFSVIIPFHLQEDFVSTALKFDLYLQRHTRVKGQEGAKVKRSLLQFGHSQLPVDTNDLTLEISRHHYTPEYRDLTKDFYLNL